MPISTDEAAEYLGVSAKLLRKAVKDKKLRACCLAVPLVIEGSLMVAQRPHQTAIRVDLAAVEGP